MKRTMYDTPILRPLVVWLCQLCLKLRGWKLEGDQPTEAKYVLVAVPHTSNWDFPLGLAIAFIYRLNMYWMGKESLFKGWSNPVMRWLGGIPINRSSSNNVVSQMIDAFNANDSLIVAIPPEGTRSQVDKWKTGFYYIALGAKVPIALAFLNYKSKTGGFLTTFHPTGDIDMDIAKIRSYYVGISGRNAKQCTLE